MKRLYSSHDIRRVGLVRSALDDAGIAYEMQNETIPYPGAIFDAEVWVVEDSEFARACEVAGFSHAAASAAAECMDMPVLRRAVGGTVQFMLEVWSKSKC